MRSLSAPRAGSIGKGCPSLCDRSDASAPSLHGVPNLGQHIRRDLGGTRGHRSRSTLSIPVDVLDEKLHLGNFSYLARDDLIGEVTDARITDIDRKSTRLNSSH